MKRYETIVFLVKTPDVAVVHDMWLTIFASGGPESFEGGLVMLADVSYIWGYVVDVDVSNFAVDMGPHRSPQIIPELLAPEIAEEDENPMSY